MEIRVLTHPDQGRVLLAAQPLQPFLQSWAWGEFQAAVGRRVWRLGAWEQDRLLAMATVIEHQLVLGRTYLYCPRGPIAADAQSLATLLAELRKLADREGAMYLKVDPPNYAFPFDPKSLSDFTPGTTLQPRQTLIIETKRKPEDLLSAMHQKTRYNIRLAEKRGVNIQWSTNDSAFATFLDLIHQTYARQGIRLHPDKYYQHMFTALRTAGLVEIGTAEYNGQPVAANLVIWHDQTATYLHGGSSQAHKEVMAPHLLQWSTMQRAHQRGFSEYDLWGIAPTDQPSHKWSGVTRFKKGLGGHTVVFPPAMNAVLQPGWYWAYRYAKRIRGGVDQ